MSLAALAPSPSSPPPSGGIARGGRVAANPAREEAEGTRQKESDTSMDPNRVLIFDTTLRDGEQSPGISLNTAEKLEIAHQLARLGVDVIEAGFPITSPGDFEAVQAIAREVDGPVIAGLARAQAADIERRAGTRYATPQRPRIHTFISTSDIHIEHQLQTTREDVKGQARAAVAHAQVVRRRRRVLADGRHPRRRRVHRRGDRRSRIDEGATTINIPDTVGYTMPQRVRRLPRAASTSWCPALQRRRALRALPRRPGPGRRQLASPACRRARARSSARSTASASAPATRRWRRS